MQVNELNFHTEKCKLILFGQNNDAELNLNGSGALHVDSIVDSEIVICSYVECMKLLNIFPICFQQAGTDLIVLWHLVDGIIDCDLTFAFATSHTRNNRAGQFELQKGKKSETDELFLFRLQRASNFFLQKNIKYFDMT